MRFSSWIGGDRDGNPHVTAAVTRQAADIAAEHVLLGLHRAASRIGSTLTLDESDTPADERLRALADAQQRLAPDVSSQIGIRSPNESHRRVLLFVAARLDATRRHPDPPPPARIACWAGMRCAHRVAARRCAATTRRPRVSASVSASVSALARRRHAPRDPTRWRRRQAPRPRVAG